MENSYTVFNKKLSVVNSIILFGISGVVSGTFISFLFTNANEIYSPRLFYGNSTLFNWVVIFVLIVNIVGLSIFRQKISWFVTSLLLSGIGVIHLAYIVFSFYVSRELPWPNVLVILALLPGIILLNYASIISEFNFSKLTSITRNLIVVGILLIILLITQN